MDGAELGMAFLDGELLATSGNRSWRFEPSGVDGRVSVGGLIPGSYKVFVEKDEVFRRGTVVVRSGQKTTWTASFGEGGN